MRLFWWRLRKGVYWQASKEWLASRAAWALPREVVYWATIRAGAHATSGQWGMESPTETRIMDVLKRWREQA